jgi:small-conductance mechanosensitive channel
MDADVLMVFLSLATLLAGVVVIVAGMYYRMRVRELRHRERLALIEKGLVPAPEFDGPLLFQKGLKQRSLSFGIIVVGLGFALMFLIGIAGGALDTGIGLGGAVVILGAAFIVRSLFAAQLDTAPATAPPPLRPVPPSSDEPRV